VADLGRFDYVIAHGLYSWVPPAVRDVLLPVIAEALRPGGIAYVSYNTLPGWRSRAMVRDMLLAHVGEARHPRARLALAQEFLARMAPAFAALDAAESRLVAKELEYLRGAPPGYLYHEYLDEYNEPLLVGDFLEKAQAAGFIYVADAEAAADLGQGLPAEARAAVADLPFSRRIQYYDFLTLRPFRRSLLTPGTGEALAFQTHRLSSLALFADVTSEEELDLAADNPQTFHTSTGSPFQASHPLTKAALMHLAARFPSSVAYPALLAAAQALVESHGDGCRAKETERLLTELAALVSWRFVGLAPFAQEWPLALPPQPRLHALARWQISHGEAPAGIRHSALALDEAAQTLALACDGSRDISELVGMMRSRWPEFDEAETHAACMRLLWTFARNGLFVPD